MMLLIFVLQDGLHHQKKTAKENVRMNVQRDTE